MQSHVDKKEAIRKYKEQKAPLGAYAVRCTISGRAWVGASRNLDATKNGCWFMLRNGDRASLAWGDHSLAVAQ